jgi:4-hydroxy-3-methylbut-2-enyl diphosphate reductase
VRASATPYSERSTPLVLPKSCSLSPAGDLITKLKENNNEYTVGDVTISLAKSYGFCWGVERAVQMAYEARKHYPDQKMWITNEIIHNPTVNNKLKDMEVKYIPVVNEVKDFSVVDDGDVVILPAFGATVQEMRLLADKGVKMVDTTCPWVSKVGPDSAEPTLLWLTCTRM